MMESQGNSEIGGEQPVPFSFLLNGGIGQPETVDGSSSEITPPYVPPQASAEGLPYDTAGHVDQVDRPSEYTETHDAATEAPVTQETAMGIMGGLISTISGRGAGAQKLENGDRVLDVADPRHSEQFRLTFMHEPDRNNVIGRINTFLKSPSHPAKITTYELKQTVDGLLRLEKHAGMESGAIKSAPTTLNLKKQPGISQQILGILEVNDHLLQRTATPSSHVSESQSPESTQPDRSEVSEAEAQEILRKLNRLEQTRL